MGAIGSAFVFGAVLPELTVRETAADVPSRFISAKKTIYGDVWRVIDGDTIRVRHRPLFSRDSISTQNRKSFGRKISEHTISIRLAGVDCPETAKFGNGGQPFATEATEMTKRLVGGQKVKIKILSRDHYGRLVGSVTSKQTTMTMLPGHPCIHDS